MARLAIDKDFLDDYSKLPKTVQGWHLTPDLKSPVHIFERDRLRGFTVDTWRELSSFAKLDRPYIYYNFGSEHRVYSTNLSKRHQYLRIVMAEILGIPEPEWDWALSLRPELLRATMQELRRVSAHEQDAAGLH